MAYERRQSSVCAAFTLSPLPYHVLLILLMVLGLLSLSWFFHYESFIDDAEEQMSWALLVIPVLLILVIRWLSSIERLDDSLLALFSYDHRRRIYYNGSNERPQVGSSPWGVAAVVILLLILVYFQSSFQDMWGP